MRISETGDSITVYLKGSIDRYSARGLREDTDTVVQMKKPSVPSSWGRSCRDEICSKEGFSFRNASATFPFSSGFMVHVL